VRDASTASVKSENGMKFVACVFAGVLLSAFSASAQSTPEPESPPSAEQFARGAQIFDSICSHCHGPHMVNPGTISFDLRKFPHEDRTRFFNSVRNGKRAMPPWKDVLHPDEIEDVWAYVRTGGVAPQ
jgi:mono/diheme cytochrome c family protein